MKSRLGRKCSVNLTSQITIAVFKLHYNLPDRVLEDIFKVDHVTIHRIFHRILKELGNLSQIVGKAVASKPIEFYVTDSTTLPIGKGKNNKTFSGYKHHHSVKFQVFVDQNKLIHHVSSIHYAIEHDKNIFEQEWPLAFTHCETCLKGMITLKNLFFNNNYKIQLYAKQLDKKEITRQDYNKIQNLLKQDSFNDIDFLIIYLNAYVYHRDNKWQKFIEDLGYNDLDKIINNQHHFFVRTVLYPLVIEIANNIHNLFLFFQKIENLPNGASNISFYYYSDFKTRITYLI